MSAAVGPHLTCHVLVHHIGSMFHKQAKHGGAAGAALQPEQDWSFLSVCLSGQRGEDKMSAPPSGDMASFTSK